MIGVKNETKSYKALDISVHGHGTGQPRVQRGLVWNTDTGAASR
jgi:hypothetical protein